MTTTRTFRQTLGRSLAKGAAWAALTGSAFVLVATGAVGGEAPAGLDKFDEGRSYPERIAARHECWTGEAPADVKVPGHVVVRYEGEVAASYRGSKAVGEALAHIFDGADNGVAEVTAFCR